jgi:uncharacterized protein (DUF2249 family)
MTKQHQHKEGGHCDHAEVAPEGVVLPVLDAEHILDVRHLPCSVKHGFVHDSCEKLPVGGWFILRNGRDPVPLREELEDEHPGCFRWDLLLNAGEDVRIRVTRVTAG